MLEFEIQYKNKPQYLPVEPPQQDKRVRPPVPKLIFESLKNNGDGTLNSARVYGPKAPQSTNPRFSHAPRTARNPAISPIIPNAPITPEEAKASYSSMLTTYELSEIHNFPEIYYLGIPSKKIRVKPTPGSNNYGFDDSNHHYKAIVGDHLAYRFEIRAVFGKGAFGQVLRCFDHKTKQQVAIKLVINTEQMHKQGKIEVAIIQRLNDLDPDRTSDIVRTFDAFIWRQHIAVSFEILGMNLYEYSRSIRFQPMTLHQIHAIAKHILTGLAFCHKNKIVHCDMKPENVLLTQNSTMNLSLIHI